jgi:hypothetical protein
MFKKINSKLENLFDQNQSGFVNAEAPVSIEANSSFQPENNNQMLENLSYVFSGDVTSENLVHLFSQLSPYFEAGILLQKDTKTLAYKTKEAFVHSKKINSVENFKLIKLPQTTLFKILKSPAYGLLQRFNMQSIDNEKKMTSYLIPLPSGYTIVVISKVAEPWARLKIESLQKTLMKINFLL